MNIRITRKEMVFLIFAIICGISKLEPYRVSEYFSNTIALIWILLSFNTGRHLGNSNNAIFHIKLAILPLVFMIVYTLFNWAFFPPIGAANTLGYYTRMLSTNFFLVVSFIFICRAYIVFGKRTLELVWMSMILSYSFIHIPNAIIHCGLVNVIKNMIISNDANGVNQYLEIHDLIFALGFFFIFFIVCGREFNVRHLLGKEIITIAYIWIGYKRIELVAIVLVISFYFLFDKYVPKRKRQYVIIGVVCIIVSVAFIVMIYSGTLSAMALRFGINFNYRIDTWSYWASRSSLSLTYRGLGMNYVDKETNYLTIRQGFLISGYIVLEGMHSDLFKKYVELGFIPFVAWLYYIITYKTRKMYFKQGFYVAEIYLLCTLFVIVLYLTDNVFNYFLCNISYLLIPMVAYECSEGMNIAPKLKIDN